MTQQEPLAMPDLEPPLPIILEARDAYFRDQQELLAHRALHPDEKWAAYHGSKRIGIGKSKPELAAECLSRGIPRKHFLILGIDASVRPIMDTSLS